MNPIECICVAPDESPLIMWAALVAVVVWFVAVAYFGERLDRTSQEEG